MFVQFLTTLGLKGAERFTS